MIGLVLLRYKVKNTSWTNISKIYSNEYELLDIDISNNVSSQLNSSNLSHII